MQARVRDFDKREREGAGGERHTGGVMQMCELTLRFR
jgi:hypothetical protein